MEEAVRGRRHEGWFEERRCVVLITVVYGINQIVARLM